MMEKFVYYNALYLIYKDLLSIKNQEIFDLYYGENMTMQEIADLKNISKSRVGMIIKNTTKLLDKYENCLLIYKHNKMLNDALSFDDVTKIKKVVKEVIK